MWWLVGFVFPHSQTFIPKLREKAINWAINWTVDTENLGPKSWPTTSKLHIEMTRSFPFRFAVKYHLPHPYHLPHTYRNYIFKIILYIYPVLPPKNYWARDVMWSYKAKSCTVIWTKSVIRGFEEVPFDFGIIVQVLGCKYSTDIFSYF